jgi:hypothetical protein
MTAMTALSTSRPRNVAINRFPSQRNSPSAMRACTAIRNIHAELAGDFADV